MCLIKFACASVIRQKKGWHSTEERKQRYWVQFGCGMLHLVVVFGALRTQGNSLIVIDVNRV